MNSSIPYVNIIKGKSASKIISVFFICILIIFSGCNFQKSYTRLNSINVSLVDLPQLSHVQSRSISPENFTGEKGKGGMAKVGQGSASHAARELGQGWKVNPYMIMPPGKTVVLADIKNTGIIQHIWMTPVGNYRNSILRFYWDDETEPSIECPVGDFFANGTGEDARVSSLAVCVNPRSGLNCYWQMPFKKRCKITMENRDSKCTVLYYQIDYALADVGKNVGYLHAQFRRTNPLKHKEVYTILDGVKGWGHYVGTYMTWGSNSPGWWGEGEIKFFIDGDKEFPTICGTGTEDYFCGSYCFRKKRTKEYLTFNTPYAGFPQAIMPEPNDSKQQPRFSLYRWHITDAIRFEKDLKVTIQALGWQEGRKYLPLQDDLSSVAFWYQTEPHAAFPKLPSKKELEIKLRSN